MSEFIELLDNETSKPRLYNKAQIIDVCPAGHFAIITTTEYDQDLESHRHYPVRESYAQVRKLLYGGD